MLTTGWPVEDKRTFIRIGNTLKTKEIQTQRSEYVVKFSH